MSERTMQDLLIEDFLASGSELLEIGCYEDLINICEEFLQKKQDPRIYALLSSAEYGLGHFQTAEERLRKGLTIDNHSPDLLFNMACIMKATGRLSNAWRFFNRAERYADDSLKPFCEEEKTEIARLLNTTDAVLNPAKQKKRVLIIAAIFPPESGSGVQRTLKLVKYIRLFGWEPVVVTLPVDPGYSGYHYFDELPDDIEVIRIPPKNGNNPREIEEAKKRTMPLLSVKTRKAIETMYTHANPQQKATLATFPDAAIFWAYSIVDNIDKYVDIKTIDLVYTTSGPYSDHFAGFFLKERFQIPWVADFRDEWSNNPSIWSDKNNIFYLMCVDCEYKFFTTADQVIVISEVAYENCVKMKIPESKLTVITNGYDEEDFEFLSTDTPTDDCFTLIHNGLLYLNRTPFPMLEAINNLIRSGKVERAKIKFHMGNFTEDKGRLETEKKINELGLGDVVTLTPYMEHLESLLFTAKAHMLVLILENSKYKGGLTGKIYEYLRFRKPILCIGPEHSQAKNIITKIGCGKSILFDDVRAIEAEILAGYQSWLAGHTVKISENTPITVYERKNLTKKHAVVFEKAVQQNIIENNLN